MKNHTDFPRKSFGTSPYRNYDPFPGGPGYATLCECGHSLLHHGMDHSGIWRECHYNRCSCLKFSKVDDAKATTTSRKLEIRLTILSIALIFAGLVALTLLTGVNCKPGDRGIYIAHMLVAGCPDGR